MIIGYARVSTQDQQTLRQIDQLKEFGCERIYEEKASGTKRDRVELVRMMDALREGDVVIITELSRLSRSVKDLFEIVAGKTSLHHFCRNKPVRTRLNPSKNFGGITGSTCKRSQWWSPTQR